MSDRTVDHSVERKNVASSDIGAFADYIREQANWMDRCGWCHGAGHLRKWASELRNKRTDESSRLGDRALFQ